jgi:hypothetical protein
MAYESNDITNSVPIDLSIPYISTTFELTDTAYDLSIDDLPFVLSINNQNPYRRETAQYKKDQFDNSQEPGEQSLSGWWLRSQTSFHNGAGLKFYEPGTDYEHVSHRYFDSRGIDVWTVGEAKLLNDVFHSYTGSNGIVSTVSGTSTTEYIITGDSRGYLKRLTLNENSVVTTDPITLDAQHLSATSGTVNPFYSITSDGTKYFAVCDKGIHAGYVNNITTSDKTIYRHSGSGSHTIKFTKGYLMFGEGRVLTYLPITETDIVHDTGGGTIPATGKTHAALNFFWNVIEGGDKVIYAAGYAGNDSEIWAVPFEGTTELLPYPAAAVQVAQLPYGEIVKSMYFYLGYLVVGTNKGIRIAQTSNTDGSILLGPLLVETDYDVTGFVANNKYIWASTSVKDSALVSACLIRIDLSTQFDDGTFAYAYDLQYLSDENSYGRNVHYADNRLHIVLDEGSTAGEIQTEKLGTKKSTGWLQTGKIRYGTIEQKWFRYINVQCDTGEGDNIFVSAIRENGSAVGIGTVSDILSNQDILISNPSTPQELLSFKFTFSNATEDSDVPILKAYQIKALPAGKRQRLIQYPLSCYDYEMDKFNSVFGYTGRAISTIQRLEAMEQIGKFVNIFDYRINEEYSGIIEEVRFTNESSPDKNSNGFGGILLVTVRKL